MLMRARAENCVTGVAVVPIFATEPCAGTPCTTRTQEKKESMSANKSLLIGLRPKAQKTNLYPPYTVANKNAI
jgi:hypothetical protein